MPSPLRLALLKPQPNLGAGTHWLQTTFWTRFSRFRGERGHLSQGRYQALLSENDTALARLVNYIHLNQIRARLVTDRAGGVVSLERLGKVKAEACQ